LFQAGTDGFNYNFNNLPSYSFSRNTLRGLGADITAAAQDFLRARYGDNTLRPTEATPLANAFGNLFGILNSYNGTYNYGRDAQALPVGAPTVRSFAAKEYEFYFQDSWKAKPDLTLTYGLRYSIYAVPYEKNGVQVVTTTPLETYWSERIYASQMGIPGYAMPNAKLTYVLGGAANDAQGWFARQQ
jgi:hypothetical protein